MLIRQKGRIVKFDVVMTEDEALREAGCRLAQIRLGRNISQAELAARAGVSKRSVERLEAGLGSVRLNVFFLVCGALGLTPGFETLLPEQQMSPQDVLLSRTLPKRARRHRFGEKKIWGNEQ